MSIAFKPEEFKDVKKEFHGVIVDADYGEKPFGMEGRPDIPKRPQLAIKISTPDYDKDQYEWYVPSNRKLTKWAYFIEALAKTGAINDIKVEGKTDEERIKSFAESLIGMEFDFAEYSNLPCIVKNKTIEVILPTAYYGKKGVEEARTGVKTETIGGEEVRL